MKTNKYLPVYNQIVEQIQQGNYPPESKLPSENDLAEQYDTSRETIRKALNLLSQNGYIQKIRGKGSIVLDIHKFDFPVSGLVSFKELADEMAQESKTMVHELSLNEMDDSIQQKLNISKDSLVWKVIRTRELGGEKVIVDQDFIDQTLVPALSKEVCEESLYAYIENDLGLKISFAKKEITVVEPTKEDRALLDLNGFYNVVVIKSLVYLEDTTLIQYTESRHRPDKFRFVDFARRSQP